jgi:hypothetical protein
MNSTSTTPRTLANPILWVSLIGSLTLVGTTAFYWSLVDLLTPFFAPLLWLGVWAMFLILLITSLIYLLVSIRRLHIASLAALLVNLVALVIVLNVPFTRLMLDLDFRLNFDRRMAIVSMVETGQMASHPSATEELVALPFGYRSLSKGGGEIILAHQSDTTIIFFYTYRGVTDNFSGFMYRSDTSVPQQGDLGGDFWEIKKLREHWLWVAAT